ncbi:fibronectin type III domain-containing protein [Streptomyces amritsarensis]|uniref:fibronectin type III domain-containing protein n=1 Tax=Streptomyces amritsarensis TaxID=681158 RepID=UPI0036C8D00D
MALKDKKTNLGMGMDLTSARDDMAGRTQWPPATPSEVLADRETWTPPYGHGQIPPAPLWHLGDGGNPVSGGWQSTREVMLFWTSGVGAVPPTAGNSGSAGLDLAGITGHNIYVAEGEDPMPTTPTKVIGAFANVLLDGLKPGTAYRIQIEAFSASGTGPKSAVLTVRTQQLAA